MEPSTLKVMFVVPSLSVGGAERHVVTLLPEMDPAKFTPSVICIGAEGDLFPTLRRAGIPAVALNLSGTRNIGRALRALVSSMRGDRPDIVVVRGYNAEMLGRLAALGAGVKRRVVWVHNIGDIAPRTMVRRIADRSLAPSTSAYFGVANAQRSYMRDRLRCPDAKVRIIHNGVDPALFDYHDDRNVLADLGIESGDPVVGMVAGLRPEKDHATLLRAARLVIDDIPNARFLIVGDGMLRPELESLCVRLGISANVHFVGNRDDVSRFLRAMDVFTLCSFTVECFPFALLEAMACGRPAVCTDVGGVGEILDHGVTGYLVTPRDPGQLAARLVELLKNPAIAHRMGRAGRARVESKFSLERSVDEAEQALVAVARCLDRC